MNQSAEHKNMKVLMYHRVVEQPVSKTNYWHSVSIQKFRQQMQIVDQLNYTPITFVDYNLYLDGKLTLPKKPIIITFDDGHLDTYELAIPVLKEFNMRAVIYVIGDRDLEYAVWDEVKGRERLPLMNDEQILDIRAEGFEIGCHTMTHPNLVTLSKSEIKDEVLNAKVSIEQLLDEEILSFAYPYGALNQEVYDVVSQLGFRFACGVYSSPPRFGDDLYNIHRLAVSNDMGITRFLTLLLTPYEYAEWVYNRIRGRALEAEKDTDTVEINQRESEELSADHSFINKTHN